MIAIPAIMQAFVPIFFAIAAAYEHDTRYPRALNVKSIPSWNSVMLNSACIRGIAGPLIVSVNPKTAYAENIAIVSSIKARPRLVFRDSSISILLFTFF